MNFTLDYHHDSMHLWPDTASDSVKITVGQVDLDIEGIDGPNHEIEEDDPGAFIGVGQVRELYIRDAVQPAGLPGTTKLKLTWTGEDKVEVFGDEALTAPVFSGEEYALAALPVTLWVRGKGGTPAVPGVEFSLTFADGGQTCRDVVNVTVVEVDLEVYDSQGGQKVQDEVTRGAFAVANLNDTDSDGSADNLDNDVPDERDLIKVRLNKPVPDLGGHVTISVTGDRTTTWLWRSENKSAGEEGLRSFATSALPLEFWLEGTAASSNLRDIVIGCQYAAAGALTSDEARATFVWAERLSFRNSGASLSADADGTSINDLFGGPEYESRLGVHIMANRGARNSMEAGFTVGPSDIGGQPGVVFDVTRQNERRLRVVDSGTVHHGYDQLPDQGWPTEDEGTNDDRTVRDEDNIPTNNHVYSIDGPGWISPEASHDFGMSRWNFREFVRVRFNGEAFDNNNTREGSRCSQKLDWHSLLYVRRGTDWWVHDNDERSASNPVLTGIGDGTIVQPTVGAAGVTEGWTVTYADGTDDWSVQGTVSGVQTNRAVTGVEYSSDGGEVTFLIVVGDTPYAGGDRFSFSTFCSPRKGNEIAEGLIAVGDGP